MNSIPTSIKAVWLKGLPIMLLFFGMNLATGYAQTFKPLEQGIEAVKKEIKALEEAAASNNGLGISASSSSGQSSSLVTFKLTYLRDFLVEVNKSGSLQGGLNKLDEVYTSPHPSRQTLIAQSREALLGLITQ